MVVLLNPVPSPGPAFVGTFFGGSSTRTAGTAGAFDWTLPRTGSVSAPPQLTLYADPGYGTVAAGPITATATSDPLVWSVAYPASLAAGAYWCEAQVTWYGGLTPIPYRGHVLILTTFPPDAAPPPWAPTLADIAALIPHRTMDGSGMKQGAFGANTKATAAFVQAHIDAAVADVRAVLGDTGGRGGMLLRRAASFAATHTIELALQPDTDVGAEGRDDASVKEWQLMYLTALDDAKSALRSGVIGSPRRPGSTGEFVPGYAPTWRGWR